MSVVGGYPTQSYPCPPTHDIYYASGQARAALYTEHNPTSGSYLPGWMLGSPGDLAGLSHPPTDPGTAAAYGSGDHLSMIMYDGTRRVVKRRGTNNKKERRRTHSINSAFAALRGCIPNVPSDTKLSKIKTLRLATSYIAYLMDVLSKEEVEDASGFKAELVKKLETREERRRREAEEMLKASRSEKNTAQPSQSHQQQHLDKKNKGRTGWPQQVWAAELKS